MAFSVIAVPNHWYKIRCNFALYRKLHLFTIFGYISDFNGCKIIRHFHKASSKEDSLWESILLRWEKVSPEATNASSVSLEIFCSIVDFHLIPILDMLDSTKFQVTHPATKFQLLILLQSSKLLILVSTKFQVTHPGFCKVPSYSSWFLQRSSYSSWFLQSSSYSS